MKLFKKKEAYQIEHEWRRALEVVTEKYQRKLGDANLWLVFDSWTEKRYYKKQEHDTEGYPDIMERKDRESWNFK